MECVIENKIHFTEMCVVSTQENRLDEAGLLGIQNRSI